MDEAVGVARIFLKDGSYKAYVPITLLFYFTLGMMKMSEMW